MIARLASGTLASLCGGFAAAWISKANGTAIKVMGVLLIALFIPVHYGLWVKFPLWYHVAFLASLMPLVLLGAKLAVIFGHKALPQKRSEAP